MDDDFRFCGNTLEMTKALEFFADWIQNAKTITLNTKPFDQGNAAIKLGDSRDIAAIPSPGQGV